MQIVYGATDELGHGWHPLLIIDGKEYIVGGRYVREAAAIAKAKREAERTAVVYRGWPGGVTVSKAVTTTPDADRLICAALDAMEAA